jgi:hypothetical protein
LKIITRFRDHTMTAYYVDGKPVYTDDGFDGNIMTYRVDDFLFNPLPPPTGTNRRDMETKSLKMQNVAIDCGMYQFFVGPPGWAAEPREVLCISHETHDLLLRETQHFSVRYKDFVPFLNKSIPRTITASKGTVVRCRIHVQQVDQAQLERAELVPPDDASPVSPGPNWLATTRDENRPIHRMKPSDPRSMKTASTGSRVSLLVLRSRSGAVKDVEPLGGPTPELIQAVVDAVKNWTYAPVIRKDRPVETMSTVLFDFDAND